MSEAKSLIEQIDADLDAQEVQAAQKSDKQETVKYILIGALLGVWLVTLVVFTVIRYNTISRYTDAMAAMKAGDLRQAALGFQQLDGYGSSEYYLQTIYAEKPQMQLVNAQVGDLVTFGSYCQDKGVAPIAWYVIALEGDRALLLSQHILDAQPYTGAVTLPDWLNDTFRNAAFDERESAGISKILLLSRSQFEAYVHGKDYEGIPTPYAISQDYAKNYAGNYMWWSGESSSGGKHFIAYPSGYLGRDVSDDSRVNGVRPAMWVSFAD